MTIAPESTLLPLQPPASCVADEALLTWAGTATVFMVGDQGRLAWRLTSRSGGDAPIPSLAAIELFDATDSLTDTLPVCMEQGNLIDPLLWADYLFTEGGPYKARITVQFTDGATESAQMLVIAR